MPDAHLSHWIVFHTLLLVLLGTEWLLLRRQTPGRSYAATALWLVGALLFTAFVFLSLDRALSTEFLAGYALEESLSIDNLFVFLLLFRNFRIAPQKQRRVLFWGILGAVILRAAFIVAGVSLLRRFDWVTYVFAVILLIAAIRLVFPAEHGRTQVPAWQRWLQKKTGVSESQDGFVVSETMQEGGQGRTRRVPTVLLLALVAIAFTDFVFALDSIPAVLSITRHTFIAYTSNILAVMGLRSLYFVLAHALEKLKYLHYGLAAVLAFAAIKMLVQRWIHISAITSLAAIFGMLLLTVLVSLVVEEQPANDSAHG